MNPRKEEGYTLIIVLWSIVIMTIIFSYMLEDYLLDNYLIEGYAQQKKLRQAALSAYNMGLNKLLNDETLYDSQKEKWLEPIEGDIDGINYTVTIKDVGSKLNLNYDPFKILNEIDDWDKGGNEDIESYLEENLIADLFLLKEFVSEEKYEILKEYTTTYGNFNVNQDSPEKLKKLFDFLEFNNADTVITSLKNYQEEGNEFTELDELPIQINGLDITIFDDLKPFLDIEGRININLVSEDILKVIFVASDISEKKVEEIIEFREENEISELGDFTSMLTDEDSEKIGDLFTTQSRYLELNVDVETAENRRYKLDCIVKRSFQEEKWSIEILSWHENDISWSDNNGEEEDVQKDNHGSDDNIVD